METKLKMLHRYQNCNVNNKCQIVVIPPLGWVFFNLYGAAPFNVLLLGTGFPFYYIISHGNRTSDLKKSQIDISI